LVTVNNSSLNKTITAITTTITIIIIIIKRNNETKLTENNVNLGNYFERHHIYFVSAAISTD